MIEEQNGTDNQGTEQKETDITPTPSVDYSQYDQLITKIAEGINAGLQLENIEELGISEAFLMAKESNRFGYTRLDVDGNGVDELLLGELGNEEEADVVYNMYTLSNGTLTQVMNGWERNRFYLCENGEFANEGSNGASNSTYAYYNYAGNELTLKEAVIFEYTADAENPWFYSTESTDVQNATSIKEDQALQIMDSYHYQDVDYTLFK